MSEHRHMCNYCRTARSSRPGGLCGGCYKKPVARAMYPAKRKYRARQPGHQPCKETMAQVEAIIAGVLAEGLPEWWYQSHDTRPRVGPRDACELPPTEPRCRVRLNQRGRRVMRKGSR